MSSNKISDYVKLLNNQQYSKLKKYAYRASYKNAAKGEDALQHALAKMLISDSPADNFEGYASVSIFNSAKYLRRADAKYVELNVRMENYIANEGSTPKYFSDEYLVQEAIEALPVTQRLTIESFMRLNRLVDVARELGMNENTTKANYRHAMLKIKQYLVDNGYELSNN